LTPVAGVRTIFIMAGEPAVGLIFPRWADKALVIATLTIALGMLYLVSMLIYVLAPGTQRAGYQPVQPVAYSHQQHAGLLGMDCRYCHNTVEVAAMAAVPPTQTCMNCHARILQGSEQLLPVRASYATGLPVPWVRVHDLPQFVYFNHSAHVNRGVGCAACHGRIDKMPVVTQEAPLTMHWCLKCHRDPEPNLRPPQEVTSMDYLPAMDQTELGRELRQRYNINPPTDCSTCHR
jgi:hypothetical protein